MIIIIILIIIVVLITNIQLLQFLKTFNKRPFATSQKLELISVLKLMKIVNQLVNFITKVSDSQMVSFCRTYNFKSLIK